MKKAKKGFVMYFDNCKRLKGLPPKWRGEVVLVLSEYAERLDRDEGAEAYLQEQLARMPGEAALTLGFLADDARRDEAKYQAVIERRDQYKEERKAGCEAKKPAVQNGLPYIPPDVYKHL